MKTFQQSLWEFISFQSVCPHFIHPNYFLSSSSVQHNWTPAGSPSQYWTSRRSLYLNRSLKEILQTSEAMELQVSPASTVTALARKETIWITNIEESSNSVKFHSQQNNWKGLSAWNRVNQMEPWVTDFAFSLIDCQLWVYNYKLWIYAFLPFWINRTVLFK